MGWTTGLVSDPHWILPIKYVDPDGGVDFELRLYEHTVERLTDGSPLKKHLLFLYEDRGFPIGLGERNP